jgi:hypothetical protein
MLVQRIFSVLPLHHAGRRSRFFSFPAAGHSACGKSESPAWGERGFLMEKRRGGDRALHE